MTEDKEKRVRDFKKNIDKTNASLYKDARSYGLILLILGVVVGVLFLLAL